MNRSPAAGERVDARTALGAFTLAASDGAHDAQRFLTCLHSLWQTGRRRFQGEVFTACKVADERASIVGHVLPDGTAEHGVAFLERIQGGLNRGLAPNLHLYLAAGLRQRLERCGQDQPDHGSVWTSTEYTAGKSRAIGFQLPPPSGDAYTWPPVVPK